MTRIVVWPYHERFDSSPGERVLEVSTVSRDSTLSPFLLGPCQLYPSRLHGFHVAKNMENAWQFSKVYRHQLSPAGEPSIEWWSWALAGWRDSTAHRYPMGKGAVPEYSYWDGQHLDYVQARKVIYAPLYAEAVRGTVEWVHLLQKFQYGGYDTIVLRDYDAYDHAAIGMSLTDVLNCPKRKMGHAFVLAMLLTGDQALNQLELRN